MRQFRLLIFFILICAQAAVSGVHESISASVVSYIKKRVNADSVSVVVRNLQHVKIGQDVRYAAVEWKRGTNDLRGRVAVPVRVYYSDNSTDLIYLQADISLFCMVPVAVRNIDRYNTLNYSDLYLELRDVTSLRKDVAKPEELISGVRTKRLITKGRIITRDMIEPVPVIRRGDRVKIVVDCRNLQVSTYGIAKEDGWPGKRIRIRTENSRRELYAEVAGPAVVKITL